MAEKSQTALAKVGTDVFDLATKHDESISKIEEVVSSCALAGGGTDLTPFKKAFVLARGLQMLQALVTDEMMDVICQLQDSPLGFRTDKDPKQYTRDGKPNQPYPRAVVKSCFIEATLRGARPIGNEWNIIAGRPYLTKEFFERKVKEFPGLSNFQSKPGVPHMAADGALVPYSATWLRDGKPESLHRQLRKEESGQVVDERIPIRVNAGMGADAILGKARRKFLAAVYGQLTGSEFLMLPEGEVDDEPKGGAVTLAASSFRRPAAALPPTEAAPEAMDPAAEWKNAIRAALTLDELREVKKKLFAAHPDANDPMRAAVSQEYSQAHMNLVEAMREPGSDG